MIKRFFVIGLLAVLSACASSSPPVKFYTLDHSADTAAGSPGTGLTKHQMPTGTSIGVGPIDLPGLLDRPQIVTRQAGLGVNIDEFHRWADGLEADLLRAAVRQLRQQLPGASISQYPWPGYRKLNYQVRVVVLELDGTLGGETVLSGNWSIADGAGQQEFKSVAFSFKDRAAGPAYEDLVASYRRLAASLTNQIAIALADQSGA